MNGPRSSYNEKTKGERESESNIVEKEGWDRSHWTLFGEIKTTLMIDRQTDRQTNRQTDRQTDRQPEYGCILWLSWRVVKLEGVYV